MQKKQFNSREKLIQEKKLMVENLISQDYYCVSKAVKNHKKNYTQQISLSL